MVWSVHKNIPLKDNKEGVDDEKQEVDQRKK